MNNDEKQWRVVITDRDTNIVVESIPCSTKQLAMSVENGVAADMNVQRYFVDVVWIYPKDKKHESQKD